MNSDVVNELREYIEGYNTFGWDDFEVAGLAVVLEHALAEIIRLNDIIETSRHVHDEVYGRRDNGFPHA